MQPDRLGDLGAEMPRQPGRAHRLVLGVDAAIGHVLRQVVQQVADVMQERRRHERRRSPVALGKGAALDGVVELAHAFAVPLMAASGEGRMDLVECWRMNLVKCWHMFLSCCVGVIDHPFVHHCDAGEAAFGIPILAHSPPRPRFLVIPDPMDLSSRTRSGIHGLRVLQPRTRSGAASTAPRHAVDGRPTRRNTRRRLSSASPSI